MGEDLVNSIVTQPRPYFQMERKLQDFYPHEFVI